MLGDAWLQGLKIREWEESRGKRREDVWEKMLAEDDMLLEDLRAEGCPFVLSINEQEEGSMGNIRATKFFDPFEGGEIAKVVGDIESLMSETQSEQYTIELQRAFEGKSLVRKEEWVWYVPGDDLGGLRYIKNFPLQPLTLPRYGYIVRDFNYTFQELVELWRELPGWNQQVADQYEARRVRMMLTEEGTCKDEEEDMRERRTPASAPPSGDEAKEVGNDQK